MSKTRSVRFDSYGPPQTLRIEEINLPAPGDDEVTIQHRAIGVNYIDSYYRTGLYQIPLPSGLGTEAAGLIEAVGKNVTHVKPGDRVAYVQGPLGSYADRRNILARLVVKIPDSISFTQAASVMLKSLTVRYLFKDIHPLKQNETILFHAAAGGVGLIACQWAKHIGAKLIGTTSSREKASVAKKLGAWEMINYKEEDIPGRVSQLTQGQKVPVVFDSVGQSTWNASIECLRPKGLLVSFGNASGPVTGVHLSQLQKGSFFVTRPILAHYVETLEKLQGASDELFALVEGGVIKTENIKTHPLHDVIKAHEDLADGSRVGGLVLIP